MTHKHFSANQTQTYEYLATPGGFCNQCNSQCWQLPNEGLDLGAPGAGRQEFCNIPLVQVCLVPLKPHGRAYETTSPTLREGNWGRKNSQH